MLLLTWFVIILIHTSILAALTYRKGETTYGRFVRRHLKHPIYQYFSIHIVNFLAQTSVYVNPWNSPLNNPRFWPFFIVSLPLNLLIAIIILFLVPAYTIIWVFVLYFNYLRGDCQEFKIPQAAEVVRKWYYLGLFDGWEYGGYFCPSTPSLKMKVLYAFMTRTHCYAIDLSYNIVYVFLKFYYTPRKESLFRVGIQILPILLFLGYTAVVLNTTLVYYFGIPTLIIRWSYNDASAFLVVFDSRSLSLRDYLDRAISRFQTVYVQRFINLRIYKKGSSPWNFNPHKNDVLFRIQEVLVRDPRRFDKYYEAQAKFLDNFKTGWADVRNGGGTHPTIVGGVSKHLVLKNNLTNNIWPVMRGIDKNIPEGSELLRESILVNWGRNTHSGLPGSLRPDSDIKFVSEEMSIKAKHDLELTAIKHYCTDPSNSIIRVSESGQMAFEQSDSVLAKNH